MDELRKAGRFRGSIDSVLMQEARQIEERRWSGDGRTIAAIERNGGAGCRD